MSTPTSHGVLHVAEPPAAYLVRPPLVIDCNVISAALFAEEQRDEAAARMVGRELHAPVLLDHEIVSVALRKLRLGQAREQVSQAVEDYAAQDICLHKTDPVAQMELAVRYNLSSFDAAYLWLAAQLKVPLATFDAKLAHAAQAHLSSLP